MALIPWPRFLPIERELEGLMNRFERLLGDRRAAPIKAFAWRPTTDVYREGHTLIVHAKLPGIRSEKDLEIAWHARTRSFRTTGCRGGTKDPRTASPAGGTVT